MVSREVKQAVISFQPISDRICSLRIRGKYRKTSILNVHMLTENKKLEVGNDYCEQRQEVLEKIPKYDIKIILGDFNGKWKERNYTKR